MGIVASLAAIPVAEDIIRDERRRELELEEERLRKLRASGYRHGDLDLQLIKRYAMLRFLTSLKKTVIMKIQN